MATTKNVKLNPVDLLRDLHISEAEGAQVSRMITGSDDTYWAQIHHWNHEHPFDSPDCPFCISYRNTYPGLEKLA